MLLAPSVLQRLRKRLRAWLHVTPVALADFLHLLSKFASRVLGAADLGVRGSFPLCARTCKSFCLHP